jgi:hypothetical protein
VRILRVQRFALEGKKRFEVGSHFDRRTNDGAKIDDDDDTRPQEDNDNYVNADNHFDDGLNDHDNNTTE